MIFIGFVQVCYRIWGGRW